MQRLNQTERWSLAIGAGSVVSCFWGLSAWALSAAVGAPEQLPVVEQVNQRVILRPRLACPTNIQDLTNLMLRDLPGYANRVSQRARPRLRGAAFATYVVVASQPEFAPLSLGPGGYNSTSMQPDANLKQVFFTTLERQYVAAQMVELQHYHWLFLTQTQSGWRLAMLFSRIGSYPAGNSPSPIREASDGVTAQAIEAWLRDCQAGALLP